MWDFEKTTDDTPDPVADDPEPDDDNTVADDDTNGGPADAVAVDTVLRFRPEELPDNYDNGQPHLSARAHVVAPSAYLHNAASPAPPESLLRAIYSPGETTLTRLGSRGLSAAGGTTGKQQNHTPPTKVGRARAAATTRAWHRLASRTRAFAVAEARNFRWDGGGAAGASTS